MTRVQRHNRFIFGTLGSAVLLTALAYLSFPQLTAGHASPVITLVPVLLMGHIIYAPGLLDVPRTIGGRIMGIITGILAFVATSALFWLAGSILEPLFDRPEAQGVEMLLFLLMLALPLIFLVISSGFIELAWRSSRAARAEVDAVESDRAIE